MYKQLFVLSLKLRKILELNLIKLRTYNIVITLKITLLHVKNILS